MNKCTGIMGRIFGHKCETEVTFPKGVTYRTELALHEAINACIWPEHNKFRIVCQRCGAVTGEKE